MGPRNSVAYQGMWTMPPPPTMALGPDLGADGLRALGRTALALLRRAHEDRDLAEVLVLAEQLMRVGDLLEAHRLPQHRADLRLLDQRVGAVGLPRVREVGAEDLLLPHPEVAHVEVQVVPGRGAADHDLAERAHRQYRGRERGLTDVLEHDVGRVAEQLGDVLREPARLLEARLLLVRRLAAAAHHPGELVAVDVGDGAELLDELALLRRGHDADRVGARELAELDGEDADGAGRAPDEDLVTRLDLRPVDQHPVGREVREAVGRGLLPRQMVRLGQQLLRLHLRELGERAPGRLVAPDLLRRGGEGIESVDLGILVGRLVAVDHDLVARLPAGDARADLPHDAGGVGAADVMVLVRVVAEDRHGLAECGPDVVEVHARGHDPDDDLEGGGLRDLDLLDLEGVDGLALALLADHPRRHRLRELARLRRHLGDLGHIDCHVSDTSLGKFRGAEACSIRPRRGPTLPAGASWVRNCPCRPNPRLCCCPISSARPSRSAIPTATIPRSWSSRRATRTRTSRSRRSPPWRSASAGAPTRIRACSSPRPSCSTSPTAAATSPISPTSSCATRSGTSGTARLRPRSLGGWRSGASGSEPGPARRCSSSRA